MSNNNDGGVGNDTTSGSVPCREHPGYGYPMTSRHPHSPSNHHFIVHPIVLSSMIPQLFCSRRGQRSFVIFHPLERSLGIMPYHATSVSKYCTLYIRRRVVSCIGNIPQKRHTWPHPCGTSCAHRPLSPSSWSVWTALSQRGICPSRQSAASHRPHLFFCGAVLLSVGHILPYSGFITQARHKFVCTCSAITIRLVNAVAGCTRCGGLGTLCVGVEFEAVSLPGLVSDVND